MMKNFTLILFLTLQYFSVHSQSIQQQEWNNSSCGTLGFFEDSLLLHIKENTFHINDPNVKEVDITIKMYANYYDMLLDDIQMKDQNGIYVSGGMYSIQVTANGQKVDFQKDIKVSYISDGNDHYNGFQYNVQDKKWDNLKNPVLDYASNNSTSEDWGALKPKQGNLEEGFSDESDDWGSEWSSWTEGASNSVWLYKTMNIKGNGLYNYDYLIGKEELITYQLKIENKNIDKVYAYYPHLNTIIYYTVNSENIVNDFVLVDASLSNVKLFSFNPLTNKEKVEIGELSEGELLKLSSEKMNSIKFKTTIVPLSKASLDEKIASI
ncbi:hypothetical protein [Flammeovirga sp. OC4]|uniref:hypothetical protein n=1 Tax=Flammeovirga sp. OC4 TaxID=1382345 RepID=UPI0005C78CFE|nr:hypothetical protein [Flammeovirga sp. OC4]